MVPSENDREEGSTQGRKMRQTSLGCGYTNKNNNIEPLHKDILQLLPTKFTIVDIENSALKHTDAIDHIKKGKTTIGGKWESYTLSIPQPTLRSGSRGHYFFKHINIKGINIHDNFAELSNAMGILATMKARVYSVVETQWGTTCPKLYKFTREK